MLPIEFLKRINTNTESGCWEWRLARNKDGYGLYQLRLGAGKYKTTLAHRMAYKLHYGSIADGKCVLHSCDNPACCNPEHLFLGSPLDNTTDMLNKGRHWVRTGERSGASKLSNKEAQLLRELYQSREFNQVKLADKFKISQSEVSRIINGKRHIT